MAAPVPRHHLVPLGTGPWLINAHPRTFAWHLTLGSLAAFLVGAIGGATALQPWAAGILMIAGVVGVLRGLCLGLTTLGPPTEQYCPRCGTVMGIGTPHCPQCDFGPTTRPQPRRRCAC